MSEPTIHRPDPDVALQEIEVAINDVDSIQSQETLRDALKKLPSVRAVRIVRGGAMISYNPVGISVEAIRKGIEQAGFTIDGIEGGRESPERIGAQETGKEIWRGPQGKPMASGLDE
jgi:hypothetical protein